MYIEGSRLSEVKISLQKLREIALEWSTSKIHRTFHCELILEWLRSEVERFSDGYSEGVVCSCGSTRVEKDRVVKGKIKGNYFTYRCLDCGREFIPKGLVATEYPEWVIDTIAFGTAHGLRLTGIRKCIAFLNSSIVPAEDRISEAFLPTLSTIRRFQIEVARQYQIYHELMLKIRGVKAPSFMSTTYDLLVYGKRQICRSIDMFQ